MMNPVECEFEAEVLASALGGSWPLGVEPGICEHVSHCVICAEVVTMAATFAVASQEWRASATLPDSSRVWWLAQLRARREAVEDATRPILATQIAACAWAVGLLVVCLGVALAWFQITRGWLESVVALAGVELLAHGTLIAFAGAVVVLLPTAAYFAMGKE